MRRCGPIFCPFGASHPTGALNMTRKFFRLPELWNREGRPGALGCGRTKVCADYLLRDPADPYVTGTDVKRLRVTYLGPKLPIVTEEEIDRLCPRRML